MRKDRTRRYRSASELADDIQNYLTGAPLIAGPESSVYRARKFMRKHAASVSTVVLVGIALIAGLLASTAMAHKADNARAVAEEQSEEYRRLLYVHRVALADASYRAGNAQRTRELLEACPEDLRGWEWNRLNYVSDQSVMTIGGADRGIRTAILSPDGKFIVSDGWGNSIKLWDAEDGTKLKTFTGHEDNVHGVALSPDGKYLASGSEDTTVRLWDVETGSEIATLRGHTNGVYSVRLSPDGKRIASAENRNVIKIWDRTTGKQTTNIETMGRYVGGLAFSPDGRHIASGRYGDIRVWDADSGAEVLTIEGAQSEFVMFVAYSPDGKHIVSCGGWEDAGGIRIWNAATGEEVLSMRTRSPWLNYVTYDNTGKYIVSGGRDNVVNIWEAASGENVRTLRGHHSGIRSAMFSSDGSRIVSSSDDRTIKVWDLSSSPEQLVIQMPARHRVWALSFSPDGKRFATIGPGRRNLMLWDAMAGIELGRLGGYTVHVNDCAFSPDGKHIALASHGYYRATVWDVETGEQRTVFRGHDSQVHRIAYSPDGQSVASACQRTIRIWDPNTGAELMTMRLEDEKDWPALSLTYNTDGSRLISGGGDGIIRVWDVASGKRILAIEGEGPAFVPIAVSRDAKLIASGIGSTIQVWDATSGHATIGLRGHNGTVGSISFSPVADRLVSSSYEDGAVKVWDTTTGLELMTVGTDDHVFDAAFSPDGSTIAALCREGIILWETKEPAGGLGPRRDAQAARQLVQRLHEMYGVYHEVRDHLSADDTLDPSVRKMALRVVESRMPEEAWDLAWNVFTTIAPFEKEVEEYRAAWLKVEKANRWLPNEPMILAALGAVQYRLGSYEDAARTLAKSMQKQSDRGMRLDPLAMAFRAMALHRIGQIEEAKAALAQLREHLHEMREMRLTNLPIAQALLPEVERLIEGTEP